MFFRSNTPTRAWPAFSLIELMVSMSIMALVSSVIITRQSAFNGAVLLRNQAYEVAFALREAQLLAVNGGSDVKTYGVYFDTTEDWQHKYRLFQDLDSDGYFDDGEQLGLTGVLDSRFEIRAVTPQRDRKLAIVFTRPNFDAKYCVRSSGCTRANHFVTGPAIIDIARTGTTDNGYGAVRQVVVSPTGQISVTTNE